uniref:FBD domain-containing protein n=1 Tax=Oryza brachyantha TaxID=4533 RepID=J3LX46_ORYBR
MGCFHLLIHTAISTWGVDELEVAVKPAPRRRRNLHYFFKVEHVGDEPRRLTKLTLRNCPPAESLRHLRALTALVLHDLPKSTQTFVYDRLFTLGLPHLKKLHLKNCRCDSFVLVVSAPPSPATATAITELFVDSCSFLVIELRKAAALEDLACIDDAKPVLIQFTNAPRLTRVHLSFSASSGGGTVGDHAQYPPLIYPRRYNLSWHVRSEHMSSLAVRFTGPERWILPARITTRLLSLRRLLVADVLPTWDVSWPRLLLQAAPSLETLHIHVASQARRRTTSEDEEEHVEPGREIIWPPATFRHRRLQELVLAGFGRTLAQVRFVRYVVRACRVLRRVELLRRGGVRYDGPWEWEVVRQQQGGGGGGERHWSREEEAGIKKQILCGRSWFREDVEVVLG